MLTSVKESRNTQTRSLYSVFRRSNCKSSVLPQSSNVFANENLTKNTIKYNVNNHTLSTKSKIFIQPKLTINSPEDKYEQEADRIAQHVVDMPGFSSTTRHSSNNQIRSKGLVDEISNISSLVQRKCSKCEEEEEGHIQRKSYKTSSNVISRGLSSKLMISNGGGSEMDQATSTYMSSRFGVDLSQVRIHNDSRAAKMSQEIKAKAFTTGNNIYFDRGQYSPNTKKGKRLLAHELTHVIQQNSNGNVSPSSIPDIQRACGSKQIGEPSGCDSPQTTPQHPKYLFKYNCNEFRVGNEEDLRRDSMKIQQGDEVEIHGFASIDGDSGYNLKLSCARALRAKEVVLDELKKRGLSASFKVFHHGESGSAVDKEVQRSVVVIRKGKKPTPIEPKPTKPNYNESVLIWLNAFIPGTVPGGTKKISKGIFAGKTCIPAPWPFGCAVSDNRTFSKSRLAKTRMRLFILVNLKNLTFSFGGFSDFTHHIDLKSGGIKCKKRASGTFRVDGKIMSKNSDALGMKFIGFGNNPCVPLSPDIDFLGQIGVDRKARRIKVQALVDKFPALKCIFHLQELEKQKPFFEILLFAMIAEMLCAYSEGLMLRQMVI